MSKKEEIPEIWSLNAEKRMQLITTYADSIDIDPNIPVEMYIHYGMDLFQMANVYKKKKDNEDAFKHSIVFTTIFLEKIPWHPEYNELGPLMRLKDKANIKQIYPMATKLKIDLLKQFDNEHKKYNAHEPTAPSIVAHKPVAEELRTITVPEIAITNFLEAVSKNTEEKNIETLGMLYGNLDNNRFRVTHVYIPIQTIVHDNVEIEKRGEWMGFNFHDRTELILLGWITTHLTESALMTSIDLHRQYFYQSCLPEAIVIVCEPKKESKYHLLHLTAEGLKYIRQCRDGLTDHDHDVKQPLFQETKHAWTKDILEIEVVDDRRFKNISLF